MQKSKKDGIIKGAFSLGVGAFICKLLGAFYRIPLTNLLGSYGVGLYQMVFPVYALLLDFSGAGAPTALSKIISSNESVNKEKTAFLYLKTGKKILGVLGLFFSVLLLLSSKIISVWQGNTNAFWGYVFLAPSIFLVCLISCYRGYFQGLMNMTPTAISQIIEQIVKVILGLLFAYLFYPNVVKAVAGATFAITLSELIALLQLRLTYKKRNKRLNLNFIDEKKLDFNKVRNLIKTAIPIIMVGILIPLSQVVDSFLVVNILKTYRLDATQLYGLLTGVVLTIINLPVSVCYGISTVSIPSISSTSDNTQKVKRLEKSLIITILIALPCWVILNFFAPTVINILYKRLGGVEKNLAINLLQFMSPCVILLALIQTQNAVLIGNNKLYTPTLNLLVGVVVKIILSVILLKLPYFNIYGSAVGIIACYFVTCLLNLISIISLKVKYASQTHIDRQYSS